MSVRDKKICLGTIIGPHGVQGFVRIKTFTSAPETLADYGPLSSKDGTQHFTLSIRHIQKGGVAVASAPEISSREAAEALQGLELFIDRDQLPTLEDEDEFYLEDLIGLRAFDENGEAIGQVCAVYNFGADDILELDHVPGVKGPRLLGFTRENVPAISLRAGTITVIKAAVFVDEGAKPTPNDPAPILE